MLIVSDTTPIISLMKINRLYLLEELFQKVWIPKSVYKELTENDSFPEEAEQIRRSGFIYVAEAENRILVNKLLNENGLDLGESEAIALACDLEADLLLVDEKRARRIAKQMDIPKTGTVGILLQAFDEQLLSTEEMEVCVSLLKQENIRLSKAVCDYVYEHMKK